MTTIQEGEMKMKNNNFTYLKFFEDGGTKWNLLII